MLLPSAVDRDTALIVLLGALAVVALGAAAATVDSTFEAGGGGGGGLGAGSGGGVGAGDSPRAGVGPAPASGSFVNPVCVSWLDDPPATLAILGAFVVLAALLYRRTRSLVPPVGVSLALGIPVFLVWVFLTACGRTGTETESRGLIASTFDDSGFVPAGGGGAPGPDGSVVSTPEALFGLVLGLALLGAVVTLFLGTGDDETPADGPSAEGADAVAVESIGQAAGAAADRIEADADPDNEVYRAWKEMTELLSVPNPDSSTPAEFAAAAVEAGMDREDVTELTALFEEVRYGGATPTADRQQRAVAALRNIESAYAGGETPIDADGERR
jgi:hypothetical protein